MQSKENPHEGGHKSFTAHNSTTSTPESLDFEQAARFLTLLDETAERWTFQTFDDNRTRKDPALTHMLHGTLAEHWEELCRLSARGAGVFITVNETNGKGRKTADIIRVRAVFRELDRAGARPLPPGIEPHLVVESSPGKFHEYLLIDGGHRFDLFEGVMQRLVDDYDSDPAAKDRSRVLRLPRFPHQKDPANPWRVRLYAEGGHQPYTWEQVTAVLPPKKRQRTPGKIPPGYGFEDLDSIKSALAAIPPDCEYQPWLAVGMALHHASGGGMKGFTLWDDWSAKGDSYRDGVTSYKWGTFGNYTGSPATLGTLFHIAQEYGWKRDKGNGHDTSQPDYSDYPEANGRSRVKDDSQANTELDTAGPHGLASFYIKASALWGKEFKRYWMVEQLIERGRVYELFGRYKGGKTLVAIDMVCHICAAMARWGGRRLAGAFVIWIAGEAVEDVEQRIAAWLRHHNVKEDIPLYIRTKPAHLDKEQFAKDVGNEVALIQRQYPDLMPMVVIDTVARNLSPGSDENSIQGLGAFINNLIDHVVRPNNTAAICVHHPGHGDSDRGRGHSSFPAAVDGVIKVTMDKSSGTSIITVSTSESRNTAGGDSFSFRIETQDLPGSDNFGNPIDAPVLRYLEGYQPPKLPAGKNECQALAILENLIATSGTSKYLNLPLTVAVVEWRAAFKDWFKKDTHKIADERQLNKSANTAWDRAQKGLHEKGITGYVGINNTHVYLVRAMGDTGE